MRKAEPAVDAKEYSSFVSDITFNPPATTLVVIDAGSGSLVVVVSGGTERTFTVANGEELPLEVVKIKSTSTVSKVRAYFHSLGNS